MTRKRIVFMFLAILLSFMGCQQALLDVGDNSSARAAGHLVASIEAEEMTISGSYAGIIDSPFAGVGLYGASDNASADVHFPTVPGEYRLDITGASSGSSSAEVTVYIEGLRYGKTVFTGNSASVSSVYITLEEGSAGNRTILLSGELDNGSWDAFIDSIDVYFEGTPPPPPPAPQPSTNAVWNTREYRNLFVEWGKTEAEVDARVDQVVNQLFYGSDNERIYYEKGSDMAYIYTADTNDVRSEGMSYGMMICVQLDMQEEFDKLWNFSKTYMQHDTGDRLGYFAWQVKTDGGIIDQNPAPDGEEYFAMALLMAANRWGNGTGIYNYSAEANYILDHMVRHKELAGLPTWSGITNMIDPVEKQVVFCIEGNSATFTDPSYHLPHFYELFARWADDHNDLWLEVAAESRQLFQDATHSSTGLAADYTLFDGTPTGGSHAWFRFDAWRVAQNIALDSYWWNVDPWQRDVWVKNYLNFFYNQGVSSHQNQFSVDGQQKTGDHSPGLVAMNATAALISDEQIAWDFVEEFWNTNPSTGTYRYYDGCLYLFGLLNVTGRFRIIDDNPPPAKPAAPSNLVVSSAGTDRIVLGWNDNSNNETSFKIERSTDGSSFSQITTVGANVETYSDGGLTPDTTYYYRVRATNGGGNSAYTSTASATTDQVIIGTVPSAPTNLGATANGTSQINLIWSDNSSNETGFRIDRSTNNTSWSPIAEVSAGTTSYGDTGLSSGTTYYYRVRAYNSNGNSAYSSTASAVTDNQISPQKPYGGTAHAIPGVIEAEKYDQGGPGVAYADTTGGNSGNSFRNDDVDVQNCSEGGYNVGWIAAGEWLEYTVNVTEAGIYDIDVRVASLNRGGSISLEMNGTTVAPSKSFSATGDWQNWTTLSFNDVNLNAGQQILRLNLESDSFNVNYLTFSLADDGSSGGGSGSNPDDPFTFIEAESFSDSRNISVVNDDGGEVVVFQGGQSSWIAFDLDFGSVEPQRVEVRAYAPNWGGNIIVRIDSPSGQEICRIYPAGGGNWAVSSNTTWPRPTGAHTVYISTVNGGLRLNSLEFLR